MSINSKSTKAEILAAYEQLIQEKKSVEAEVKKLKTQPPKPINSSPESEIKPVPIMTNKAPETLNINLTLESLEKLKSNFGSSVSNLSEQLIAEATTLDQIQTDLTQELTELTELHNLEDIEDDTLDQLIEDYEESSKAFADEFTERSETLTQELQDLTQSWEQEKDINLRSTRQRDESYQKERKRESEEYQYNLKLEVELDQETYQATKNALYQELAEIKEEQEKKWQQREETITKQEQEYTEAQAKVDNFEQVLAQEKQKGKDEGKGIGHYQAKIKSDLRTKEIEGEKKNYELRIQSLQQTLQSQLTRLESLSRQIEVASRQVQDLAVKAIEGSSNRNNYEAMKEIALEQAKNTQKAK